MVNNNGCSNGWMIPDRNVLLTIVSSYATAHDLLTMLTRRSNQLYEIM